MDRAQTATEYLVILAVVIIIALVVIGVLGGIPGIGGRSSELANLAYLESLPIGIESFFLYNFSGEILIRNNVNKLIEVTAIELNQGADRCFIEPFLLKPGKSEVRTCVYTPVGDRYSVDVAINYTDTLTDASYRQNDADIIVSGDVAKGLTYSCAGGGLNTECIADLNNDGVVSNADLAVVQKWWFTSCDASNFYCEGADMNCDDGVSTPDMNILIANMGSCNLQ